MNKFLKIFTTSVFAITAMFLFTSKAFAIYKFNWNAEPPTCTYTTTTRDADGFVVIKENPGIITYHAVGEFIRCSKDTWWNRRNFGITPPNNDNGDTDGYAALPRSPEGFLFTHEGPVFGSKNNLDTKILQAVFVMDGQNITVDGIFGPITRQGLVNYQNKYRILPATGSFTPATRNFIESRFPKTLEPVNIQQSYPSVIEDSVTLQDASTKLEKVKSEIAKMTSVLSELSQQAAALEAFLKK